MPLADPLDLFLKIFKLCNMFEENVQQFELRKVAICFLQGLTMNLKICLDELIVNLYLRVNLVLFRGKVDIDETNTCTVCSLPIMITCHFYYKREIGRGGVSSIAINASASVNHSYRVTLLL